MPKKIIFTSVVFAFSVLNTIAQTIQYKNFDLDDKPPVVNLTTEELQKNKAIILNEFKARELVLNANNEMENYFFYSTAILINDVSVIDKYNKIYIPVSDPANLITLKCRTTQPDGKSIDLFKGNMKRVTEDGEDYNILALEGLEKNSIIEYFYLKRIAVAYYNSEAVKNKYLVKKYTNQLICSENLLYASKPYNNLPPAKDTTYNSKNFLTFSMTDLQPAPDEKYATDNEKFPRYEAKIEYNLNNKSKKLFTYADVSKKIIQNYHQKEDGDEKTVNKIFKKLDLDDIKTTDEKIFTIESYIKNDIGLLEYADKLTMTECLEKKGLTKFLRYKLAIGLLEKCNINYEVICTSYKNNQPFDEDFESYAFLDAVILNIPETKKRVFFDNILYRYGDVPSTLLAQKGLVIKPILIGESYSAVNSIKYLDPQDGKNNYDNMECDITFNPTENKLNIFTTRTLNGYSAVNIRPYYFYFDTEKRTDLLTSLLKNGLENSKVTLPKISNFDLRDYKQYNQPLICSGIIDTKELTEVAGSDYIIKIGSFIGEQAELYQEEKRRFRIYAGFPHSDERVLNFIIPDGYTAQGLEKLNIVAELKENNNVTAFFNSSYKQDGNKIIITINEAYNNEFYEIENFEGFRKVINAAADFNKVSLLLKKK